MKIGVVADDITGANDIGSMFANGGNLAHVYAWDAFDPQLLKYADVQPDVCILDTNSRLDTPEHAYRKVFAATEQLQQAGCDRFFNKTCSVFRGNIGAEFDAMLDALAEPFAVVVLGFPKNGRLTIDGVHYVHGQRLEDSPFRNDPSHPTMQSNLVEILQAQTQRTVALIDHHCIAQGADVLRKRVEQMREHCDYLIFDVPDQASLRTIAQAVAGCRVLCGSAALAEELPAVWGETSPITYESALPPADGNGVLCTAGSLTPQTRAQIDHLRSRGTPIVEVNTLRIFTRQQRQIEIDHVVGMAIEQLLMGRHVVVHAANQPQVVVDTRAEGMRHGLAPTDVARLVEGTLAEITAQVLHHTGARRLVVAGGETSASVCRKLNVHGMRIWKEIEPGLPSCIAFTDPSLLLVLKSGSFGSADFLQQAIEHVQSQSNPTLSYGGS